MALKTKKSAAKKPASARHHRSTVLETWDKIQSEAKRWGIPIIEIRDRDHCEGRMLKPVEAAYQHDALTLVKWAGACGVKAIFFGHRSLDTADMMFESSERGDDGARIMRSAGDYDTFLRAASWGGEEIMRIGVIIGGVSVVSAAEATPGYIEFFKRKKLAIEKAEQMARDALDSEEMREEKEMMASLQAREARAKVISAGAREMSSAPEFFSLPSRAAMGGAIAQAFPDIPSVLGSRELNALVTAVHQQALLARARAKATAAEENGRGA